MTFDAIEKGKMKEDLIIDGCAFTETEFTGVTEDVLHSKMDAFFLTIPGEGEWVCCQHQEYW